MDGVWQRDCNYLPCTILISKLTAPHTSGKDTRMMFARRYAVVVALICAYVMFGLDAPGKGELV